MKTTGVPLNARAEKFFRKLTSGRKPKALPAGLRKKDKILYRSVVGRNFGKNAPPLPAQISPLQLSPRTVYDRHSAEEVVYFAHLLEFPTDFPKAWSIRASKITTTVGTIEKSDDPGADCLQGFQIGLSASQFANLGIHRGDDLKVEFSGKSVVVTYYNAFGDKSVSKGVAISPSLAEHLGIKKGSEICITNGSLRHRLLNPKRKNKPNDWADAEIETTPTFPKSWEWQFKKVKAQFAFIDEFVSPLAKNNKPGIKASTIATQSRQRAMLVEPMVGLSAMQMSNLGVSAGKKLKVRFKDKEIVATVYNACGMLSAGIKEVNLTNEVVQALKIESGHTIILETIA